MTLSSLKKLVIIDDLIRSSDPEKMQYYADFYQTGSSCNVDRPADVPRAQAGVRSSDVLNIQFTSGTTGAPKCAMLTNQ